MKFFGSRVLLQPWGMTVAALQRKFFAKDRGRPDIHQPHPLDLLYGIDTGGDVSAGRLRTGHRSDAANFGYIGTHASVVRTSLGLLPNLEDAMFVDLGCGKGRALAAATEFPFRRIVGLELSPDLCRIARQNARVMKAHGAKPEIEIVETDATLPLALGAEAYIIVFLYNPMFSSALKKVADNIAEMNKKVMIIYHNPAAANVFDRHPAFSRYAAFNLDIDKAEAATRGWSGRTETVVIWQCGKPVFTQMPGAMASVKIVAGGASGVLAS